jgi:hypothetical protein
MLIVPPVIRLLLKSMRTTLDVVMTKRVSATVGDFELLQLRSQASKGRSRVYASPCWHYPLPLSVPAELFSSTSLSAPEKPDMSFHNQPHAGPAGAPPNMAQNFNAMLQRSMHEPGQPELAPEGHGQPPSSVGKLEALRVPQR